MQCTAKSHVTPLKRHAHISYVDQYVPVLPLNNAVLHAQALDDEELRAADCVVILTDHSRVDYQRVVREAQLVVDMRNATGHLPGAEHVWRLTRPTSQGEQKQQEKGVA